MCFVASVGRTRCVLGAPTVLIPPTAVLMPTADIYLLLYIIYYIRGGDNNVYIYRLLINIINIKTALNILSTQSGYNTHFFVESTKELCKITQCGGGDMWG